MPYQPKEGRRQMVEKSRLEVTMSGRSITTRYGDVAVSQSGFTTPDVGDPTAVPDLLARVATPSRPS